METQKVTGEIESNIKELTEKLTKYQDHLNTNIIAVIKRLRNEKKLILNDIAIMTGAIQAYQVSQKIVTPANDAQVSVGA